MTETAPTPKMPPPGDANQEKGPDRKPWHLTSAELRLLGRAGLILAAAAALLQIALASGQSQARSALIAAITMAVGVPALVIMVRVVERKKEIRISIVVASCLLVLTGILGGLAGYGVSKATSPRAPLGVAPPEGSSQSPGTSTPTSASSASPTATSATPKPSPMLPSGIVVTPNLKLDSADFCSWRLGTHPMPLKSLQPVRIRIDGRCNYPQDPDPATDSPTGIYRVAQQNPADAIATLKDGTVITLTCYTYGQNISDAAGNLTSIWLHIALSGGRQGYVPDVNAGNYSARQLKALGIHRCS